jgi:hypothetical protein
MNLILLLTTIFFGGTSLALWIKFNAANHTAKALLDKLKNTAENLDETKRDLASANLTLDAMRVERTSTTYSQPSSNGSATKDKSNHSPENKKRKYYRRPKND